MMNEKAALQKTVNALGQTYNGHVQEGRRLDAERKRISAEVEATHLETQNVRAGIVRLEGILDEFVNLFEEGQRKMAGIVTNAY